MKGSCNSLGAVVFAVADSVLEVGSTGRGGGGYADCVIALAYDRALSFFLLVWPPRFQSLLIMGWCCSIPEHRL